MQRNQVKSLLKSKPKNKHPNCKVFLKLFRSKIHFPTKLPKTFYNDFFFHIAKYFYVFIVKFNQIKM